MWTKWWIYKGLIPIDFNIGVQLGKKHGILARNLMIQAKLIKETYIEMGS